MFNSPQKLHAVSSFRPLADNPEVARNQIRAVASWTKAFDVIYLFGARDPLLTYPNVQFIDEGTQYPSIASLAFLASRLKDPCCLINADIVVAQHLRGIAQRAWDKRAVAWTSQRREYDPATFDLDSAEVLDMGADIFCAQPWVWQKAWEVIPGGFKIGGGAWDNWMLGFFQVMFKQRFLDMTKLKPIYHPKHGARIRPDMGHIPRDRFIDSGHGFPYSI